MEIRYTALSLCSNRANLRKRHVCNPRACKQGFASSRLARWGRHGQYMQLVVTIYFHSSRSSNRCSWRHSVTNNNITSSLRMALVVEFKTKQKILFSASPNGNMLRLSWLIARFLAENNFPKNFCPWHHARSSLNILGREGVSLGTVTMAKPVSLPFYYLQEQKEQQMPAFCLQ